MSASHFDDERHTARAEPSTHDHRTPGLAGAGQGRQPAEPGARSASLDGRRWSGSLQSADGGTSYRSAHQDAKLGSVPSTHCADFLSAKENSDSCKVRAKQQLAPSFWNLSRPTAAPPCAFILLSSGRWSASHRSFAILRQTAIGQKPGQAEREQVPREFGS